MAQNKVNFFEDSYQFESIITDLNIRESFIEYKLNKQFEYRPTNQTLWAEIFEDGIMKARYEFIPGKGIKGIKMIGCTVEHKYTGTFAICDQELLNDANWLFSDNRKIQF